MASTYLTGSDLAAFGVPNATATQVQAASGIVDGFLQRPAGCVYDPVAQQMLSTAAPIVEIIRGRQRGWFTGRGLIVSYMPVASVISISWWQSNAWTPISWTYEFDPDGEIHFDNTYGPFSDPGFPVLTSRGYQITYLAGWIYENLPLAMKQATANIIIAQQQIQSPAFSMAKSGDTQYTRASKSLLDDDTKAMLAPYQRMFAW